MFCEQVNGIAEPSTAVNSDLTVEASSDARTQNSVSDNEVIFTFCTYRCAFVKYQFLAVSCKT